MANSSSPAITEAVQALQRGELVAVPTETVYGLAADATNEAAVAKIFAAKGRPSGHPLIAHLADPSWLEQWTHEPPELAELLGRAFWPGPLTLIVRRSERIPPAVTGGLDTVAVRVPANEVTREIIRRLGRPVAAPSANRFGSVSPTRAEHVKADLGDAVALVVDGGPCDVGVESTIVDLMSDPPVIVRPGGVTREQLEAIVGRPIELHKAGQIAAPGTHASHYAPRARLSLVPSSALADEARTMLAAGMRVGALVPPLVAEELHASVFVAPLSDDPERAAHELYEGMRQLDALGCDVILASLPEELGIGVAVADRLRRAAHGSSKE